MSSRARALIAISAFIVLIITCLWLPGEAQQPAFRNAPASAVAMKNPYQGSAAAAGAGKLLYAKDCAQCHGNNRQGMGPAPALDTPAIAAAKPGELFWFITTGKLESGMPSWSSLSKQERWQIVTFLKSAPGQKAAN